jgi:hypothetical protein
MSLTQEQLNELKTLNLPQNQSSVTQITNDTLLTLINIGDKNRIMDYLHSLYPNAINIEQATDTLIKKYRKSL